MNVDWEFLGSKTAKHLVHLLTVLHHIVAGCHLHRQQHTGMAVLLYSARHGFVLAHHAGHIADTGHLARHGVREDNLVGNLLFAILLSLHMDGHLLVVVADRAAHRRNTLGLQSREEHLLTDAIGL